MIARVIEWSVRNKPLVLLLTAVLIVSGVWAAVHSSIDAVPDLSDVQVIVITHYAGQAPQVVEDQVTYPLTTALMGIPHAKAVRGQSMFETSMIYVIFDEGTDLYWARSRVLEYLNFARDSAKVDYVDIVQVATLQSYLGSEHPYTQLDWSTVPAFAKLGLDPNVDMQADEDLSAAMEAAMSMLQ